MDLKVVAKRVEAERLRRGWGKEEAGRRAGVSSITWKRVEDGLRVQDASRAKVLRVLDLDDDALPSPPLDPAKASSAVTALEPADPVLVEKLADVVYNLGQLAAEEEARTGHSPTLKKMLERMISGEEIPLAARDKGRRSAGQTRRHHQDTQTEETP